MKLKCKTCGAVVETHITWSCPCGTFLGSDYESLGFEKIDGPADLKQMPGWMNVRLDSGRYVQVMVNQETGLLVVDVAIENKHGDLGGNECVRMNLNNVDLSHLEVNE